MRYGEINPDQVAVETVHSGFVPVAFAGDVPSARHLRSILERHNIPALIDNQAGLEDVYTALGRGVPVLVPDQMHDRASDVIAEEETNHTMLDGTDDGEGDDYFDEDDDEDEDEDEDDDEDFDDLDNLDDDCHDEDDDPDSDVNDED